MKYPVIFLDQDNTLITTPDWPKSVQEVNIIPGVISTLKKLCERGYRLVIVSNQGGIARGLVTEETIIQIQKKILNECSKEQIPIWKYYYCSHHPDAQCGCRKPEIGMVNEIIDQIDYARSFMIGDKEVDVQFGKKLGVQTILIAINEAVTNADYQVKEFSQIIIPILKEE